MASPVCLVTGGTSGIGRAVAGQLAAQGATVLLTGRNRARGEAAVAEICGQGGSAEFLPADFASLASVRALAAEVRQRHDRLHILVNNAGFVSGSRTRRLTADGDEETFAVNHLATFLLTNLLRDLLVVGAPARVVTVSSDAHRMVRALDFDNLQCERRYKPFLAYGQSKLANILFTYELSRQLEGSGVTANCLHPGVVRTGIWQAASGVAGGHRPAGTAVHDLGPGRRSLRDAAGGRPGAGGSKRTLFPMLPRGAFVGREPRSAGGGAAVGNQCKARGPVKHAP